MTFEEMKQRIKVVINTLDALSRNGGLDVKGASAIQEIAGCFGILSEISKLEGFDVRESKE